MIDNIKSIMQKMKQFFKRMFSSLNQKVFQPFHKILKKYPLAWLKKVSKWLGLVWLAKQIHKIPNKYKKGFYGIMFVMPWIIGMFLIGIPVLTKSIRMALSDKYYYITNVGWQITGKWYDFTQFHRIFTEEPFHLKQILDTFGDIALVVPLVVVFALILSMMLNQKIKGRGVFRTIFFIPVILLSGNMLANFQSHGLLTVPAIANGTVSAFMTEYFPEFFTDIITASFSKIVLILWLSGVQILIFLAGLQKMDPATYEAAEIDGASMWEIFWKITLPALIPLIYINIIYTTIVYSNLSNNAIVSIINQHSDEAGTLSGTLTDEINYGRAYSAAMSWILFTIELLIIGGYSMIIKIASKRYD